MRSKIDSPAVTEPQRDDRTLATEKWIVQSRGVPFLRRPPGRFVRESGYLIRIINSARSLSPKLALERRGQQNVSFLMAQKNPPSQAALVLIVDDDEGLWK